MRGKKYWQQEKIPAKNWFIFFGSHDFGWFNQEEVMPWTENYERFISKSKAKNFLAAIEEAQNSSPTIEVEVMRKDKESEIRHESRRTQGLSSSSESEVEQELEKAESESENEDENENEDEYEDKMDIDKVEDDVIQEEKPNKKKEKRKKIKKVNQKN